MLDSFALDLVWTPTLSIFVTLSIFLCNFFFLSAATKIGHQRPSGSSLYDNIQLDKDSPAKQAAQPGLSSLYDDIYPSEEASKQSEKSQKAENEKNGDNSKRKLDDEEIEICGKKHKTGNF